MTNMLSFISELHKDESGQGLVEYLLMIGLIALALIVSMQGAASKVAAAFTSIGSRLQQYVS